MGLLNEIRSRLSLPGKGRRGADDDAAAVVAAEAALSRLAEERATAQAAVAEATDRRRTLLLCAKHRHRECVSSSNLRPVTSFRATASRRVATRRASA